MASLPKPLDYAAYRKSPEIKRRYDIVDGEWLFMSPAPDLYHQEVSGEIFLHLHAHAERFGLGKVYHAPADVIIRKNPMRTRQPDVMFVSTARLHLARDAMHGGPDVVVEVLSPANSPQRVQQKLVDYAAVGAREAWIADPKRKTVAVWHAADGEFHLTAEFRVGRQLRSRVLPRLRLAVEKVFPR
jgi:Uma2 family endonuclease